MRPLLAADNPDAVDSLRASCSRVVLHPLPDLRFAMVPMFGPSPALDPPGTEEQDKKTTHGRPSEDNIISRRASPSPGDFKPNQAVASAYNMSVSMEFKLSPAKDDNEFIVVPEKSPPSPTKVPKLDLEPQKETVDKQKVKKEKP